MSYKIGIIQKRLLLLLDAGVSYGLSYTPRQRSKVLSQISRKWEAVRTESLRQAIQSLYKNKLIDMAEDSGGKITLKLADKGKKKVLEYRLEDIKIERPSVWDCRWRLVLFDIPNSKKKIRELFRTHLMRIGFRQYQKSVFIHPYECSNQIDFLVEFFGIRKYVRQMKISELDDDLSMRDVFSEKLRS